LHSHPKERASTAYTTGTGCAPAPQPPCNAFETGIDLECPEAVWLQTLRDQRAALDASWAQVKP
jgi:hypothetical protein